jgi:hypothetical protein
MKSPKSASTSSEEGAFERLVTLLRRLQNMFELGFRTDAIQKGIFCHIGI